MNLAINRRLHQAFPLLSIALIVGGMAAVCAAGSAMLARRAESDHMAAIIAGRLQTLPSDAAAPLLDARARYLLTRGNIDEAQAIADRLASQQDRPRRARLLYAIGNARLRYAMSVFRQVPFRVVRPVIGAAKSDYRQALQIDPANWDARYNFALAAALLPDTQHYQPSAGAQMSHDRAVWPDIPGAPTGMP